MFCQVNHFSSFNSEGRELVSEVSGLDSVMMNREEGVELYLIPLDHV